MKQRVTNTQTRDLRLLVGFLNFDFKARHRPLSKKSIPSTWLRWLKSACTRAISASFQSSLGPIRWTDQKTVHQFAALVLGYPVASVGVRESPDENRPEFAGSLAVIGDL